MHVQLQMRVQVQVLILEQVQVRYLFMLQAYLLKSNQCICEARFTLEHSGVGAL